MITKNELRERMRAMRRTMTAEEVCSKSAAIQKSIFSLDCIKSANSVCTFVSAFKEPDTTGIINTLLKTGREVIVPVTLTENNMLLLSYIDSLSGLRKGAFGIPEPAVIKHADTDSIGAVLVPGLAFDRRFSRMGFGKGFYDRLLAKCTSVKIGLCYDFQLLDKIPSDAHDVPMDFIVTESEILDRTIKAGQSL